MNINLNKLFPNTERPFVVDTEVTAVQFADGLLVVGFNDSAYLRFGKVRLSQNGTLLPVIDNIGRAKFFYLDPSTRGDLTFDITRVGKESKSYDLIADRPYAKSLTKEVYATLPETLKSCYELSKDEKPVTYSMTAKVRLSDMVVNTINANFDCNFANKKYRTNDTLVAQSFLGVSVDDNDKLLNYLRNFVPAFTTTSALMDYFKKYESKRSRFADTTPDEGKQYRLFVYNDCVHIDYYDKPYHPEYEKVLATKRNGRYYADSRKVDRLVKPTPLREMNWKPNTLYAKDYETLLNYVESIEKTLLFKK